MEPQQSILQDATNRLQQGDVVVLPTETVYGLAGIATHADAVQKIYDVKKRPAINPLIAHCLDIDMVMRCAVVSPLAKKVLQYFSPGPITVVLPRHQKGQQDTFPLADLGCAGLDTIAVRIPSHPIMRSVIEMLGVPVFAPSANISGRLSPTTYIHAQQSLKGCGHDILIVDGGQCDLGLESTIVQITDDKLHVLRHGSISVSALQALGVNIQEHSLSHTENPIAPGQLKTHYAPRIPLYMDVDIPSKNHAYLGFGDCKKCHINLSPTGDLEEAGRNLFASLHALDDVAAYAAISVAPIPNVDIGIAINDKLRRAATK